MRGVDPPLTELNVSERKGAQGVTGTKAITVS